MGQITKRMDGLLIFSVLISARVNVGGEYSASVIKLLWPMEAPVFVASCCYLGSLIL